ncbi:1-acyl-sn-glycerol-3-phosphate acyltransferase [Dysgonomonas sp. PH5-45]|uniref:lysophospholipid acyltransferase family protein n=1 Tax=unclassified Dysgonomonas TaxID=2630389 RepID=UPI0024751F52|nr:MULTISPECIES: lysophospholipid acyltransferase family protein [unclassified Dysgonomonas]MDH6355589.1 1-acyl-sn-glycerol-3-phosphate acyltransferase [Dysgonomonas sp. PH5-45]MDH6388501.1 1-acyl-sn-glycerol-3-phosphate acyltransferase [Dysgonomonas sp. PH5-37]
MISILSKKILEAIGWKIENLAESPQKCVICVAPHTSNWDLILGKLIYSAMGRRACFLIKKTWFFFPMNLLFNAIGGIPVDRSKRSSLTEQMADEFGKRDTFQLAITPEGTRKKAKEWKKGFYYIALAAKVPILIVVLDYKKKTVTFKDVFYPTGDVDSDLPKIQLYYAGAQGRHPDKFEANN